jgi:hypothetical protein
MSDACRFCGQYEILIRENEMRIFGQGFKDGICYFTECLICRARGPIAATNEEALAKWQNPHAPPPPTCRGCDGPVETLQYCRPCYQNAIRHPDER